MVNNYLIKELNSLENRLEKDHGTADEPLIRRDIFELKQRIKSLETSEGLKAELSKMEDKYNRSLEVLPTIPGKKRKLDWEKKELKLLLSAINDLKIEISK